MVNKHQIVVQKLLYLSADMVDNIRDGKCADTAEIHRWNTIVSETIMQFNQETINKAAITNCVALSDLKEARL